LYVVFILIFVFVFILILALSTGIIRGGRNPTTRWFAPLAPLVPGAGRLANKLPVVTFGGGSAPAKSKP